MTGSDDVEHHQAALLWRQGAIELEGRWRSVRPGCPEVGPEEDRAVETHQVEHLGHHGERIAGTRRPRFPLSASSQPVSRSWAWLVHRPIVGRGRRSAARASTGDAVIPSPPPNPQRGNRRYRHGHVHRCPRHPGSQGRGRRRRTCCRPACPGRIRRRVQGVLGGRDRRQGVLSRDCTGRRDCHPGAPGGARPGGAGAVPGGPAGT